MRKKSNYDDYRKHNLRPKENKCRIHTIWNETIESRESQEVPFCCLEHLRNVTAQNTRIYMCVCRDMYMYLYIGAYIYIRAPTKIETLV